MLPHSNSNIVSNALEKMASVSKKPLKKSFKSIVFEQKDQIEAALAQGYTWAEIALEILNATKEAYPDNSEKWIDIAPATLRKYVYCTRKLHEKHTPSTRSAAAAAIANPFEQRL